MASEISQRVANALPANFVIATAVGSRHRRRGCGRSSQSPVVLGLFWAGLQVLASGNWQGEWKCRSPKRTISKKIDRPGSTAMMHPTSKAGCFAGMAEFYETN